MATDARRAPPASGVGVLHPVPPWGTSGPMVPFRGGARVDMEAMQMSILVADASKHVATTQRWGLSRTGPKARMRTWQRPTGGLCVEHSTCWQRGLT